MINVFCAAEEKKLKALLFEKIAANLAAVREHRTQAERVVLVVPAQFTLSAEEEAFDALGGDGFFDLHVISGEKLRSQIVSDTGGCGRPAVNRIGRAMLLRRIAAENSGEFTAFSRVCNDEAFLDIAADFIVQLKQNNLSSKDVAEIAGRSGGLLSKKLKDMSLICSRYEELMQDKFTDSEDLLRFAGERAPMSPFIRNSIIYYYGFYSFTVRETEFLNILDQSSCGLNAALLCGSGPGFAATRRTVRMLGAPENVIPAESVAYVPPRTLCVRCANPFTMAQTIGSEICRLVRDEDIALSEIAVLTGADPGLAGTLKRTLTALDIPVFMDEKRSVMHTPAMEAISALLDICCGNFKAKDVIRFVKSGVLGVDREKTEDFENYVNLYHINGRKFLEAFKYGKTRLGEERFSACEELRRTVAGIVKPFCRDFDKAETIRDKALVLLLFLEEKLRLPQVLDELSAMQLAAGYSESSGESSQLWDAICSLLDQMVELIGDDPADSREFRDILTGSLADIKLGILPQSEGRVQIGSITRAQLSGKKAIFVAGFNDGVIPSDSSPEGILTEKELGTVAGIGYTLSKGREVFEQEEIFSIYKSLRSAEKYLWLGYTLSDDAGNDSSASPMLEDIRREFGAGPELPDIDNALSPEAYLQSGALASLKLPSVIRESLVSAGLPPLWKAAFNILGGNGFKAGLLYKNNSEPLGISLSKALYAAPGEDLSMSPSRLDSFAGCAFKHFINYGLRPMEERDFELSGIEIGDIYHEALLRLCVMLSEPARKKGLEMTDPSSLWMTVTDGELENMLSQIMDNMSAASLDGLMTAGKAEEYRSERIRAVCLKFAGYMVEQVRQGRIRDMFFETSFGRGRKLPPVELCTDAGKVYVEGKIDRVDILPGAENENFVKIVDYKSGSAKFSRDLIEKGLNLQLMIYLEGATGAAQDRKPGGIFYYNIKDPGIAADFDALTEGSVADDILEKIRKEYCLDGLIVDSPAVMNGIDKGLLSEGKSSVVGVRRKNDGSWSGGVIPEKEMQEFRERFRNNLMLTAGRLAAGDVSVSPRKEGNSYDACKYCSYSGICFKDMGEETVK